MSLNALWERLEDSDSTGIFQRIEEGHTADFYAAIDARGRRGLILISEHPPSVIPELENLEIESSPQTDGRWRTSVWVNQKELQTLFTSLVEDIVAASRPLPSAAVAQFVASRILRWRDLLETSKEGMALWQLRGLVAELVVFQKLCNEMAPISVVEAWVGPYAAAQDFVFQNLRIEAKAIGPTSRKVRITSADQLSCRTDVALRLITVAVASVASESSEGFTTASLINEIRSVLSSTPQASGEFEQRLAATGVGDAAMYDHIRMRIDSVRTFVVDEQFPKIIPAMIGSAIEEVSYSLVLADIERFERAFGE